MNRNLADTKVVFQVARSGEGEGIEGETESDRQIIATHWQEVQPEYEPPGLLRNSARAVPRLLFVTWSQDCTGLRCHLHCVRRVECVARFASTASQRCDDEAVKLSGPTLLEQSSLLFI